MPRKRAEVMKKCICCGFEPTFTNRQLLYRYKKEFGDWPVMEMIERGWLVVDRNDIEAVRAALLAYFEVSSMEELNDLPKKMRVRVN